MNIDLGSHNFIKEGLSLKNELEIDKNLNDIKKDMGNAISDIVDKFGGYAIKAMPFPESVKDVLLDIKKVFVKKDFKNLISTVISSCVREGLETIGAPITIIKDIGKLGDVIKKGGIINGIVASVEIIANKYVKNNILGDYVGTFFEKVKDSIKSRDFVIKLDKQISKVNLKNESFKEKCKDWYDAYNKMDTENINKIAWELSKSTILKGANIKIKSENRVIQNMTKLVNNKKERLSKEQLQLCQIV